MCGGCVVEVPSPCPFHDPPSIRPSARPFVFSSGFVLVDGSCGWVGGGVYGCPSVSALGFSMRLVAALNCLGAVVDSVCCGVPLSGILACDDVLRGVVADACLKVPVS